MSGIEKTIAHAMSGDISHHVGIARVSVHTAVTRAIVCRLCGSVLDNSTAQVVETSEGSITPLCGDHHQTRDALSSIAERYGVVIHAHTWEGTETIDGT